MNIKGLQRAGKEKSVRSFRKATEAINQIVKEGGFVTFVGIQRLSGLSRTYLYRQPEIRKLIEQYRDQGISNKGSATDSIIQMQKLEIRRLQKEVQRLRSVEERLKRIEAENAELKKQLKVAYDIGLCRNPKSS